MILDKATVTCCRAVFIHKLGKKLFAGVPEWYLVERRGKCRRRGLSLHHWIWTQIIRIGRAVGATISTCLYQSAVISSPTPAFRLSCSCTSLHILLTHAKAMQVTILHLPRAKSTSLFLVASCGAAFFTAVMFLHFTYINCRIVIRLTMHRNTGFKSRYDSVFFRRFSSISVTKCWESALKQDTIAFAWIVTYHSSTPPSFITYCIICAVDKASSAFYE